MFLIQIFSQAVVFSYNYNLIHEYFFLTLIIFVIVYFLLNWFVKTSSKKISNGIRTITIILSIIVAITMAYAGRFLFSLPFLLMVLPLVKTKLGLSLFQFLRIGIIKSA